MIDPEMAEIIEGFCVETSELLEQLGQDLIQLEQGIRDPKLLNAVFRSVHTIKGTSSFIGFENISALAHKCEDLFNRIRRGEIIISMEIMDIIFEAYDSLRTLLEKIKEDSNDDVDISGIVQKLADAAKPSCWQSEGQSDGSDEQKKVSAKEKNPTTQSASDSSPRLPVSSEEGSIWVPGKVLNDQVSAGTRRNPETTIRVDVERLDSLLNLTGELVLGRNRLLQIAGQWQAMSKKSDLSELLATISEQIDRVTTEIQTVVMKIRMVPIARVFNKLPRLIRDLRRETGKEVNLIIEGEDTELDKTIIEELNDPLLHLLRNAMDHGIESPEERERIGKNRKGTIIVSAGQEGNHIVVSVADDGRGMDAKVLKTKAIERGLLTHEQAERMSEREALNLIFVPGFSTAPRITNLSGRGVGMDVVATNISNLKGEIEIESRSGEGTRFRIRLPLTLAIIQTLLVESGKDTYAIPLDSVVEVFRLSREKISKVLEREIFQLRGSILPLIRIQDVFGRNFRPVESSRSYGVVIGGGRYRVGLIVDSLLGQKELVIKPLSQYLGKVAGISGSTILGDGRLVMILDSNEFLEMARHMNPSPVVSERAIA